jgi:hypothetical protein
MMNSMPSFNVARADSSASDYNPHSIANMIEVADVTQKVKAEYEI